MVCNSALLFCEARQSYALKLTLEFIQISEQVSIYVHLIIIKTFHLTYLIEVPITFYSFTPSR